MNKKLEDLLERVPNWPEGAQEDAVLALGDIERSSVAHVPNCSRVFEAFHSRTTSSSCGYVGSTLEIINVIQGHRDMGAIFRSDR